MPKALFILLSAFLLSLFPGAVLAQSNQPPDYRIYVISNQLSADGAQITLELGIYNIGGAANVEATVFLTNATNGEQLGVERIRPLAAQDTETVTFDISTLNFPAGSAQSFQASVGVDEVEARGSATVGNNEARIGITIPQRAGAPAVTAAPAGATPGIPSQPTPGAAGTPAATIPPPPAPSPTPFTIKIGDRTISVPVPQIPQQFNLLGQQVNLNNPLHLGLLIAAGGAALLLLWVITVILRLMFYRAPVFTAWQPAYAITPFLDPNTPAGRRQLWQQHAQNDMLPGGAVEGNYHIRKLLQGSDGSNLGGWHITGMRISQYDMYGRVSRSHSIAPPGLVKRLDGIARKGRKMDEARVRRRVAPVAKDLLTLMHNRVKNRNLMLPLALDIRLRGMHGEVRIVFELHQCQRGMWRVIDTWEPEMTIYGGSIQENFTYTFYGKRPDEKPGAYRKRLQQELTFAFTNMIRQTPAAASANPPLSDQALSETSAIPPVQ